MVRFIDDETLDIKADVDSWDNNVECPFCGSRDVHLEKVHVSKKLENSAMATGPEIAGIEFFCENGCSWVEQFYSHKGRCYHTTVDLLEEW